MLKSACTAALALLCLTGAAASQEAGVRPAPPAAPITAPRDIPYPGTIRLTVDASDTDHRIFRVRETVPVQRAGPMTLLYPQWLPGNHAPRGPIAQLAGLVIRANGQVIPWRRDPVEVYAFHLDVPAGVSALDLQFEYLTPTDGEQGRVVVTPEMLNLQWEKALLYPAGHYASGITVEPSVVLPAGWSYGVALERGTGPGPVTGGGVLHSLQPVSLETLVDSPMFAGRYYKQVDLDPEAAARGRPPVRLNIVGDAPENLEIKPAQLQQHRALVRQADLLFGARHFDRYDFLLATTERMGGIGLEHHRSSENGVGADYFTQWDEDLNAHDLLPHEYVHSWNGKHRRGADLWTPNYNVPMRNSLLWVYEGQTSYWGPVLAARSGLLTKAQTLETLAMTAAAYQARAGRAWRSVADTTFGPVVSARRPQPWTDYQRAEDYYTEGSLIWLDADTLIRERSGGRRSLDDFARRFFGGRGGRATVVTYTFDDVVSALNAVQPYDWATFLRTRVEGVGQPAPLAGFARGGYRLVYRDTPSSVFKDEEATRKVTDLTYSLGLVANREGRLTSVRWQGPAYAAGLAIGAQIMAVNGQAFDGDRLRAAVRNAKGGTQPIELLVKRGDQFRTVRIAYAEGLRYPHLERIPGAPARLDQILAAR
ncbi:MAG: peptidase M61 [Proteobacteria bacterium]|nr:peptidase M61 [Pseudomonadota bacterium]